MKLKVRERSPLARVARMVLKSPNVAMVLGTTIHLSGVDRETFLRNHSWVAHEMCHIRQFQEHGFFRFLGLYLLESFRKGYYHNKYEVEARMAGRKETPPAEKPLVPDREIVSKESLGGKPLS